MGDTETTTAEALAGMPRAARPRREASITIVDVITRWGLGYHLGGAAERIMLSGRSWGKRRTTMLREAAWLLREAVRTGVPFTHGRTDGVPTYPNEAADLFKIKAPGLRHALFEILTKHPRITDVESAAAAIEATIKEEGEGR